MCFCSQDHQHHNEDAQSAVSRRDLFRQGAASAMGAGVAVLLAQATADAQVPAGAAQGGIAPPAVPPMRVQDGVVFWGNSPGNIDPKSILAERQGPGKTTGLKFRALVRYSNTLTTETLTLLPLHPLQVVIRMQASQTCYSFDWPACHDQPGPVRCGSGARRSRNH